MYDVKDNTLGFAGTAFKAFGKKRMKSGMAHQLYESN
jgi:hypothetical protein